MIAKFNMASAPQAGSVFLAASKKKRFQKRFKKRFDFQFVRCTMGKDFKYGVTVMNKRDVLEQLKDFPYAREDYWVVAGSAMVLYGIREETGDIDLGCDAKLADELERDGCPAQRTGDGNRRFKYGDHIEIFENWLYDTVKEVEGIPVISVEGLLKMKKELGRQKDRRDVRLIKAFQKRTERNARRLARRKKGPAYSYDPAKEKPIIRSSICTGEKVAGFKNLSTGAFREVILIRDEKDLKAFLDACGLDHIDTEY